MKAREKVLDATVRVIEVGGFDAATIVAIAAESGVSRQTVYSIFGTREAVISESMARLSIEAVGDIERFATEADSALDYVVELIVGGRAILHAHPVLATLMFRADGANPVFDRDMIERAVPVARGLLTPLEQRYEITPEGVDALTEILVRVAVSVVFFDSPAVRADDSARQFLRRWLAPLFLA